jgi:hypothetical protein
MFSAPTPPSTLAAQPQTASAQPAPQSRPAAPKKASYWPLFIILGLLLLVAIGVLVVFALRK